MNPNELELLSTCNGFVRAVLQLDSYPWAQRVYHDMDKRGAVVALKAANGSGKTVRIAAPVALWHAAIFPGSLTIATAGVFRQVKEQLFPAIRAHAHKFQGWEFNECEVVTHHGSRILGFSTDEAGKFEGWHNDNLLLILDEATASVDTETEMLIQDALKKIMKGRTCIIIAHRLSTIRDVNRIIVMRRGEIVEQGSHGELLRLDGYYRRLYELLSHAPVHS